MKLVALARAEKAFRLELRLRNNRLIKARERLGHVSAKAAATALGMNYPILVQYESLKLNPLGADGEWRESAKAIADAFYADPEDLWPKEARQVVKSRVELETSFEEVRALLKQPEEVDEDFLLKEKIQTAVKLLSPREQKIIRQRFFKDETLATVGAEWGVSVERTRAIEHKAIRRLRDVLRHETPALPRPDEVSVGVVRTSGGSHVFLSSAHGGGEFQTACGRIVHGTPDPLLTCWEELAGADCAACKEFAWHKAITGSWSKMGAILRTRSGEIRVTVNKPPPAYFVYDEAADRRQKGRPPNPKKRMLIQRFRFVDVEDGIARYEAVEI